MLILPIGDENPTQRTPFINWLLLGGNAAIFIWALFFYPDRFAGRHSDPWTHREIVYHAEVVMRYGLIPAEFAERPWTILTSMFLHAGWAHLLGNLLFLWIVGDNIEDRLGHISYLLFYLVAGGAAGMAHLVSNRGSTLPCIGASGAISGMMGAYLVLFPRHRIRFLYVFWFLLIHAGRILVPAIYAIGAWFLLQLLYARTDAGGGVAYMAHIGGFAAGALGILLLAAVGAIRPPAHQPSRR